MSHKAFIIEAYKLQYSINMHPNDTILLNAPTYHAKIHLWIDQIYLHTGSPCTTGVFYNKNTKRVDLDVVS